MFFFVPFLRREVTSCLLYGCKFFYSVHWILSCLLCSFFSSPFLFSVCVDLCHVGALPQITGDGRLLNAALTNLTGNLVFMGKCVSWASGLWVILSFGRLSQVSSSECCFFGTIQFLQIRILPLPSENCVY